MDIIPTSVVRAQTGITAAGDRRPPSALIPLPDVPIHVRLANNDDVPFIDELQKRNNKSLGFMPQKALEGKIKRDEILIAEEGVSRESLIVNREDESARLTTNDQRLTVSDPRLTTNDQRLTKVGYLIGNDRYAKRDELGCIFQLCVVPDKRRGLRGATLLKALFERASYGCKLYCCWCAQDLEANYFWESMGFVPVAFRTGSRNKNKRQDGQKGARIHIFWQKRIRAGDTETPYWYPHETGGGSIGEDRIVLPIDPRIHWSQVKLEVLPGEETGGRSSSTAGLLECADDRQSPEAAGPDARPSKPRMKKSAPAKPVEGFDDTKSISTGGLRFGWTKAAKEGEENAKKAPKQKPPKAPRVKQKNDPEKVKAARYVRDRYMEEINRGDYLVSNGKYDVTRLVENAPVPVGKLVPPDQKLLAA